MVATGRSAAKARNRGSWNKSPPAIAILGWFIGVPPKHLLSHNQADLARWAYVERAGRETSERGTRSLTTSATIRGATDSEAAAPPRRHATTGAPDWRR